MASNILVDITSVASSGNAPGSWADINALAASDITVQGTNSVLLLIFTLQQTTRTDNCAEYRFTVNGSSTGSPVLTQWTDNTNEGCGLTMVWAVDGLSGGANSFAVQWQNVQGTVDADESRNRILQVFEITGGNASIIVDQSASNQVGDPGTWADLFTANSIAVDGTGSILIMIGNVPFNMEADESTDFQFAVDSGGEGAVTRVYTDESNGGGGWSGVHVRDGLSVGNHDFHLQWQAISGAGQTRAVLRTFQVVEITANAELKLDLSSTFAQSAPDPYANVTGLVGSYDVAATDAIHLMFANLQITATGDCDADFSLAVDGNNEGGEIISFTDSSALASCVFLARAKTGLSVASHAFSIRWQDLVATPTLDTGRTRTFYCIEFTQLPPPTVEADVSVINIEIHAPEVQAYKLEGITKDKNGNPKGTCECFLCKDNGDDTCSYVAYDQSDGSGNYSFTGLDDNDAAYFVLSWKDDTPHIFDVTDHVLQPTLE